MTNLTSRAKELRKNSTDAERLLWKHLKAKQMLGLKFRRQEQIGRYIAGFVSYEAALIVEADGGQHNDEKAGRDADRNDWLSSQRFKVLRFWNHDILRNVSGVLEVIRATCLGRLPPAEPSPLPPSKPSPQPSPIKGKGG